MDGLVCLAARPAFWLPAGGYRLPVRYRQALDGDGTFLMYGLENVCGPASHHVRRNRGGKE